MVTADQPSSEKRFAIPFGQPSDADWLSTAITVSASRPRRPATAIASWFVPSSSSASPTRQNTLDPSLTYYYYVESISIHGVRERFTPIQKVEARPPDEETEAADEEEPEGG